MYTQWLAMVCKTRMLEKKLVETAQAKEACYTELTKVKNDLTNQQKVFNLTIKELTKAKEANK